MTAQEYPQKDPEILEIYAGDTYDFGVFIFDDGADLASDGWGSWEATWRPTVKSEKSVALTVDSSDAGTGQIGVSASADATRQMFELRAGAGQTGVWDLQAENGSTVRTWVWGVTLHRGDVTR